MSTEIELLHKPFRKWLDAQGVPYTYSRTDRATGQNAADADFLCHRNHRCLHIEFKMPKTGVLSARQKARHAELESAGCHVFVIRDLAKAVSVVIEWLKCIGADPTREQSNGAVARRERVEPDSFVHQGVRYERDPDAPTGYRRAK